MNFRPQTPNFHPQGFYPTGFSSPNFQPVGIRNADQTANLIKRITLSSSERGEAMHILASQREYISNLGKLIWESPAAVAALLGEIISAYPHLASISNSPITAPTSISQSLSVRVCNALALFQTFASSSEVRKSFLAANIPMYLFPFLHTTNQSRECEHFKLASLAIIGNLVKSEEPESIEYLLNNEFVPLCLRILKFGPEINKIVAAYILQKIISDPRGRDSICATEDRLSNVISVFKTRIIDLARNFIPKLSRNVVAAYNALLQTPAAAQKIAELTADEISRIQLAPECDDAFIVLINRIKALNFR